MDLINNVRLIGNELGGRNSYLGQRKPKPKRAYHTELVESKADTNDPSLKKNDIQLGQYIDIEV